MMCRTRPATLIVMLCAAFPVASSSENIPTFHGKVTHPVIQELMGGCSLRCAFFWETVAGIPGTVKKPAPELCDDDASSFWISSIEGPGAVIEFRIPGNLPPECRDTPFYGIGVADGVIRSPEEFRDNARVKSMTLSVNKKPIAKLRCADTWKWQDFHFPDIKLNQGDVIGLTIDEIYPGGKFSKPALSEIVLQGAH